MFGVVPLAKGVSLKSHLFYTFGVSTLAERVWPEFESFNNTGMGPIPFLLKETCQTDTNFNAS